MSTRVLIAAVLFPALRPTFADETIYRYEGDVLPDDPAEGWVVFNACEAPCSVSLQDGHLFLEREHADSVNYNLRIAEDNNDPALPPTLWVEWRFRSNQRFDPGFPRWSAPDGMNCACFPCDSSVSGHFDRGIQWVTGKNKHFVFNSTTSSGLSSMEQTSRVTRACLRFVNWMKRSV